MAPTRICTRFSTGARKIVRQNGGFGPNASDSHLQQKVSAHQLISGTEIANSKNHASPSGARIVPSGTKTTLGKVPIDALAKIMV